MAHASLCFCDNRSHDFVPFITYLHETTFATYEGTVIARCPRCGVLKTFPPQNPKEFNPLVEKFDTYEKRYDEFYAEFKRIEEFISLNTRTTGTVLDVGCSVGIFLKVMQDKGYKVSGIEPIRRAASIARKRTGANIFTGTLEMYLDSKRTTFDLILLNHVLEHMTNPKKELTHIRALLKSGGYLFVGVPSRDNMVFTVRGKYWEYLLPNEHVWHLARRDLNRLLQENGFEIVDIRSQSDNRREYPLLKRAYFSLLTGCNALFKTGESYMVLAKKK